MTFFREMGVMAYPLTVVAGFLAVEIVRAAKATADSVPGSSSATSARIHPVLLWGTLGAVLGILGTTVGVAQAAGVLAQISNASPGLIWGGIKVALSTSIVGLCLLGIASIAWLTLQFLNGRHAVPID